MNDFNEDYTEYEEYERQRLEQDKGGRWKRILIAAVVQFAVLLLTFFALDGLLTDWAATSDLVCRDQRFSSPEEAIRALEERERKILDETLKECPPYSVKHVMEYDDNWIVFYSYCETFDGTESSDYAVRILHKNTDGTYSFDVGYADFYTQEFQEYMEYSFFTEIETSNGRKTISFLYLPEDSKENVYFDGVECQKELVSVDDEEFYICYAITKRDSFLTKFFIDEWDRHHVKIK